MRGENGNRIHFILGGISKGTQNYKQQTLRYCPLCNAESKKEYGWYYWHRSHQVRWLHVCPNHQVPLQESPIAQMFSSTEVKRRFFLADEITMPILNAGADNYKPELHKDLINMAEDVSWLLLRHGNDLVDINDIVRGYKALLKETNLVCNKAGAIATGKLAYEIRSFYLPEFLSLLNSDIPGQGGNWIHHFFKYTNRILQPYKHLLLIRFLGFSAREFIEFIGSRRENTLTADVFASNQLTVISQSNKTEQLKPLWADDKISLSEIGRRLQIDRKKVRREAMQLGLPPYRSEKDAVDFENQKLEKRNKWLSAQKKYPNLTLAELLKKTKLYPYKWLLHYDYEWLMMHMPKRGRYSNNKRTDWDLIDQQIADSIPGAVSAIMSQGGGPVRATQKEILTRLDKFYLYSVNRKKLPKTVKALSKNVETKKHHALRKIEWAIGYCSQKKIHCSRSMLFDRLRLYEFKDDAEVIAAFEDAFDKLTKLEQEYYRVHARNYSLPLKKAKQFGAI